MKVSSRLRLEGWGNIGNIIVFRCPHQQICESVIFYCMAHQTWVGGDEKLKSWIISQLTCFIFGEFGGSCRRRQEQEENKTKKKYNRRKASARNDHRGEKLTTLIKYKNQRIRRRQIAMTMYQFNDCTTCCIALAGGVCRAGRSWRRLLLRGPKPRSDWLVPKPEWGLPPLGALSRRSPSTTKRARHPDTVPRPHRSDSICFLIIFAIENDLKVS